VLGRRHRLVAVVAGVVEVPDGETGIGRLPVWEIGRRVVEYEQRGAQRAEYAQNYGWLMTGHLFRVRFDQSRVFCRFAFAAFRGAVRFMSRCSDKGAARPVLATTRGSWAISRYGSSRAACRSSTFPSRCCGPRSAGTRPSRRRSRISRAGRFGALFGGLLHRAIGLVPRDLNVTAPEAVQVAAAAMGRRTPRRG
jgi:hypothetical protein